jgi:uncharacterized protein YfaP (DUF2135 family)
MMKKIYKLVAILMVLLSSCEWDDEPQDCEQVRISPSNAPAYWVTICTEEGGGIPVTNTGQGGQK